jgi:hypothetical protein
MTNTTHLKSLSPLSSIVTTAVERLPTRFLTRLMWALRRIGPASVGVFACIQEARIRRAERAVQAKDEQSLSAELARLPTYLKRDLGIV